MCKIMFNLQDSPNKSTITTEPQKQVKVIIIGYLGFLELRLEQDFERDDVLGPFLPGQVDVAEFSLAQGSTDVEVLQGPTVVVTALRVLGTVRV